MIQVFEGKLSALIFFLIVTIAIIISLQLARRGKKIEIRRLSGIDAIEEAIGRAAEMGGSVHFVPGMGGITSTWAAQTLAGYSVLGHVARHSAKAGVPLHVSLRRPEEQPITAEIARTGYLLEGREDLFNPENVRYLSNRQFSFASGVMGILQRENVKANVMVGAFWVESLIFAEVGNMVGAFQVGGTGKADTIPFFVVCCDYTLIGEEIMAAGAYLSREPIQLGSILGQDLGKMLAILLTIVVVIAATLGISSIVNFFGL